jgi:hypothetical protein
VEELSLVRGVMVVELPFLTLVSGGEEVCDAVEFVDIEDRGRSKEDDGVSENVRDFRRAGGKKPRVLRGNRAISVGTVSFGSNTHESCFQGGSKSAWEEFVKEGGRGRHVLWLVESCGCQPFEAIGVCVGVLSLSGELSP